MRALLVVLLLISAAASAGNIYRWVDAQGQVHYGQAPPQGVEATAQHKTAAAPAGAGKAESAAVKPAVAAASAPLAATPDAAAKAKADKDAKVKNCAAARQRIEFLETNTAHRIQVPQKDGSTARMTDEEFDKGLADAKKAAASNCGS